MAQVRQDYQKQIQDYTQKFKSACSEFEIGFELMDTESDFDISLLAYLNKRKRLG